MVEGDAKLYLVGWVERSETQQLRYCSWVSFLNPTYTRSFFEQELNRIAL
jgi:hypothetical protein